MFEVISISKARVTRYVHLRNCETGTIEHCFDDSFFCDEGQKDFWFMKVGERYECKILLFGRPHKPDDEIDEECLVCRVIGPMEKLGLHNIIPIESEGNYYYISEKDAKKMDFADEFIFHSSRRDLVQVDDVISPNFLR